MYCLQIAKIPMTRSHRDLNLLLRGVVSRLTAVLQREVHVQTARHECLLEGRGARIAVSGTERTCRGVLAGPLPGRFCGEVHHWCDFLFLCRNEKSPRPC